MRFDHGQELVPRDDFRHVGEKFFAAGGLLFMAELGLANVV
jgi:hypothetical protein